MQVVIIKLYSTKIQTYMNSKRKTTKKSVWLCDKKSCPVTKCMDIIWGKWKIIILNLIHEWTNRFGKLQKTLPDISKQMLTTQLRELEQDGILERKIYPEIPPKVEYLITKKGKTLFPVIEAMHQWGEKN